VVTTGDVTVQGDHGTVAEATPGNDATETGSSSGGDAPGDTSAVDSPPPPPVDAGCTGVICAGNCTGAATCQGCGGANLLCQGTNTCTSDCTACPSNPIQCFACNSSRLNPIGTCEPDQGNAYCLDTNYAGAYTQGGQGYHCACNLSSDCLAPTQVCISVGGGPFGCFTCGEAFTQGATCQNNGKCNMAQAKCN